MRRNTFAASARPCTDALSARIALQPSHGPSRFACSPDATAHIGHCIAHARLRTLHCLCIKRSATLRSIHRGWTPRQPLAASRYLIKIGEPDGQRWG